MSGLIKSPLGICTAILLCTLCAYGQQVPNIIETDNYLPYLTEQKKQEKITANYLNAAQKKYPQTSQELYPELYKYQRPVANPPGLTGANQSIPQYGIAQNSGRVTNPALPLGIAQFGQTDHKSQMAVYENDLKQYNEREAQQQKHSLEAWKALYKPEIVYHLGLHNGQRVDPFIKASELLQAMLNGTEKTDFMRAVFAVESAVDNTLTWNEFNSMFQEDVQLIGALMKQDKLSPTDNLAKIMGIYRFMTDTTKVFLASKEKTITSKPMLYDFEDYEAKKDLTKVFVSKLLRTGSGQCMSLPTLFLLYAKAINANVNLAFAPEHSYITFKDNNGIRQNIELTGKMFTTTDFYWQTGFIKSEQVKSGIYLKPLSDTEVLVHLMTTLARAYVRTFGTDERLLDMAMISKHYAPNDLSANMLMLGYKKDLLQNIVRQYDVYKLSKAEFDNDMQRKEVEKEMYAAYDRLKKDLGYTKMPDWAYKQWLEGVDELAKKQQHIVKKRQLEQQLKR